MPYFGVSGVAQLVKPVTISGTNADGEPYVVNVRRLASGDADYCEALLTPDKPLVEVTSQAGGGASQKTTMSVEFRRYRTAVLARGIASWNLDDETGAVLPVNEQTVKMLLDEDADLLFLRIKRFNEPLTDEQQGK